MRTLFHTRTVFKNGSNTQMVSVDWKSPPDSVDQTTGWYTGKWRQSLVTDREWEVEVIPLVTGQRSVKEKEWLKSFKVFGIEKEEGKKIILRLGHTLIHEQEKLFARWKEDNPQTRSYTLTRAWETFFFYHSPGRVRTGEWYNNGVILVAITRQSLYIQIIVCKSLLFLLLFSPLISLYFPPPTRERVMSNIPPLGSNLRLFFKEIGTSVGKTLLGISCVRLILWQ